MAYLRVSCSSEEPLSADDTCGGWYKALSRHYTRCYGSHLRSACSQDVRQEHECIFSLHVVTSLNRESSLLKTTGSETWSSSQLV